ncbi:hypothetical protein R5R35_009026 [Gryllus longicercus]|uniref:Uncharacterized protein n=1 Tax=Gryllus longicercus TaxID=2509291 RepID=A0AAN9W102_9ORTH
MEGRCGVSENDKKTVVLQRKFVSASACRYAVVRNWRIVGSNPVNSASSWGYSTMDFVNFRNNLGSWCMTGAGYHPKACFRSFRNCETPLEL